MSNVNKLINSTCHICKVGLPWVKKEVIMLDPCEHLVHKECFEKLKSNKCPMCQQFVKRIIHANDFKYDKSLYQKCIDIISVSNFDKMSEVKGDQILLNLPTFLTSLMKIPLYSGYADGQKLCGEILSMNDIKIHVRGLNKLKSGPKVFIANHTSHLDFFAIFYVLKTGFLASRTMEDTIAGKQASKIIPLLMIDRGNTTNTVAKMKNYVNKYGSICLFPEGMLTHPNTLIKFRTGAFYVGYPVYPIVLKYKNVIGDTSSSNFILKIASAQQEVIEMTILDPFYPPFDEKKIETVRNSMAKKGKLLLSRVSNKDIKEDIKISNSKN